MNPLLKFKQKLCVCVWVTFYCLFFMNQTHADEFLNFIMQTTQRK